MEPHFHWSQKGSHRPCFSLSSLCLGLDSGCQLQVHPQWIHGCHPERGWVWLERPFQGRHTTSLTFVELMGQKGSRVTEGTVMVTLVPGDHSLRQWLVSLGAGLWVTPCRGGFVACPTSPVSIPVKAFVLLFSYWLEISRNTWDLHKHKMSWFSTLTKNGTGKIFRWSCQHWNGTILVESNLPLTFWALFSWVGIFQERADQMDPFVPQNTWVSVCGLKACSTVRKHFASYIKNQGLPCSWLWGVSRLEGRAVSWLCPPADLQVRGL